MSVTESTSTRLLHRHRPFLVGGYRVEPRSRQVIGDHGATTVEPKVLEVLICLAEAGGDVVTREEIFARVWPDTNVTDKTLTRAISELRKALGDQPVDAQVVATVPRVGYRLVATTAPCDPEPRRLSMRVAGGILAAAAIAALVMGAMLARPTTERDASWRRVAAISNPGQAFAPALSPDGETLAYSWRQPGGRYWRLYLQELAAQDAQPIGSDEFNALRAEWSHDGQRLAYFGLSDDICTIRIRELDGGAERAYPVCEPGSWNERALELQGLAWTPDGTRVAFSRTREPGGPIAVHILDLEQGTIRRLSDPPNAVLGDTSPEVSPDGRYVSFTREWNARVSDLYRIGLAEGREDRLTTERRAIRGHFWDADGTSMILSSDRQGRFGLWRLDVESGELSGLPTHDWNAVSPTGDRVGRRLAYEEWSDNTDLWRTTLTEDGLAAGPQPLTMSSSRDRDPGISPDGGRVAFVSERSGAPELWMAAIEGTAARQLTSLAGPVITNPAFSPDGHEIAFEARGVGDADVFVVSIADGATRRITASPSDEMAPAWSPDGGTLVFGSMRSGAWRLWSVDAAAAPAHGPIPETDWHLMSDDEAAVARYAADGTLYFARVNQSGLWRLLGPGHIAERVAADLGARDWLNWDVVDAGLVFVRRGEEASELVLEPLDGEPARTLLTLPNVPTSRVRAVAVAADLGVLVQARYYQDGSRIVVVDRR